VQYIQNKYEDFGDLYAKYGLSYLMRVKDPENDPAYEKFIINLADIIVEQAKAHPTMPPLAVFSSIENVNSAFHAPAPLPVVAATPPAAELPQTVPVPGPKGPNVTWFVYVAGRETDYVHIRTQRTGYGKQGGFDWQPYLPADKTIGTIAAGVAATKSFQPETLLISQKLIEHLREAEDNNTAVLLLVDPWTMKLESYTKPLCEFDKNRLDRCMMLVVWNKNDAETNQQAGVLRAELQKTFFRSLDSKDIFRDSISSEEELQAELGAALDMMRKKIMHNPHPKRPVEAASAQFPKLNVPGPSVAGTEVPAAYVLAGGVALANAPTGGMV
jgi:FxsC-like protein